MIYLAIEPKIRKCYQRGYKKARNEMNMGKCQIGLVFFVGGSYLIDEGGLCMTFDSEAIMVC